jgi:hypothetical protein
MPGGIIGHDWRRPVPRARPQDRAVALTGEFSVSASEEHPSSRYNWTPWRAILALRARWPGLRIEVRPLYDDP